MRLSGKVALITGAARGIGRGCALELANAGADIAINDREATADTQSLTDEITAMGRRAVLVAGDSFERSACDAVVQQTLLEFGRIDVLVSNPAFSRRSDFLDFDPNTFEQVVRGTLFGGFHMSQLVSRHMVERGGGGKIVFISSVHARRPYARSVAYNAGKSGLNHMAFTIAAELINHRINVNVIEPGWIETPGEVAAFGVEVLEREGKKLPWGRIGQPRDIGRAAVFLCSEDADYITGTSLVVDGGFCLRDSISSPSMSPEGK